MIKKAQASIDCISVHSTLLLARLLKEQTEKNLIFQAHILSPSSSSKSRILLDCVGDQQGKETQENLRLPKENFSLHEFYLCCYACLL